MIFLVPDPDDESLDFGGLEMGADGDQKAQLDQGEASRAAQKVDLDLDDAPFLEDEDEDEDEEVEAEAEEEAPKPPKERKPLPPWVTSKAVILGAPIGLILIIAAIWFITRPPSEEPAPPPPMPAVEEPVVEEPVESEPVKAPPPPPVKPEETLIRLEPFWIEQTSTDGTVRFLVARFALTTTEERLAVEFNRKLLLIRDALFYYLKNKDLEFVSNEDNSEKLKADLLTVINQYIGAGQFKTLLIEEYLVK